MHRSDGAVLEAELLGHKSEADYLEVGQWFELTTDEEELSGRAQIVAIDDDVTIGEGEGNLVVSRFKTTSQQIEVARLFLESDEQIVGTPGHRTWCLNRQQFIGLSEFVAGDVVETYNGPVKVICVETTAEPIQQVFNLEIAGQHVYRVGESGVLIHNSGGECHQALLKEISNTAIAGTRGLQHSFGKHGTQWFSRHGGEATIKNWQNLIEQAVKSKKVVPWTTGADETVGVLARIGGDKFFFVQAFRHGPRAGELATAFIPNRNTVFKIMQTWRNL